MTGPEAIAIIRRLDISQAEFARLVDISATAVSYWATGKSGPSGPAATILLVLEQRPDFLETLRIIMQPQKRKNPKP